MLAETMEPETPKGERGREQILDSAIKVFSQQGFGGASLRAIAQHAGVSHSMIKYYFGGKEQLWRAAVSYLFERQLEELLSAAAIDDGDTDRNAVPRMVGEQAIRYYARHPEHARIVMEAAMAPGPHLDWVIERTRKVHQKFQEQVIGRFSDFDESKDSTAVAIHYLFKGAYQLIFALEHEIRGLYGVDVTDEAFVDQFVELALGILAPQQYAREGGSPGTSVASGSGKLPQMQTVQTDAGLELRILIPGQR